MISAPADAAASPTESALPDPSTLGLDRGLEEELAAKPAVPTARRIELEQCADGGLKAAASSVAKYLQLTQLADDQWEMDKRFVQTTFTFGESKELWKALATDAKRESILQILKDRIGDYIREEQLVADVGKHFRHVPFRHARCS